MRILLSARGDSRLLITVATAPLSKVTDAIDTSSNSTGRSQPYGGGVDRPPGAEQMQQQIDLVDAVAESRPTAHADPRAAPVRVEVAA
jgi:hypothetical protein